MDEAREELLRIRRELNEMDRTYDVADGYPSSSPSPERHISEACTATAASRIEEVVTEVQEQREVAASQPLLADDSRLSDEKTNHEPLLTRQED